MGRTCKLHTERLQSGIEQDLHAVSRQHKNNCVKIRFESTLDLGIDEVVLDLSFYGRNHIHPKLLKN